MLSGCKKTGTGHGDGESEKGKKPEKYGKTENAPAMYLGCLIV